MTYPDALADAALVRLLSKWVDAHPEAQGQHHTRVSADRSVLIVDADEQTVGEFEAAELLAEMRVIERERQQVMN